MNEMVLAANTCVTQASAIVVQLEQHLNTIRTDIEVNMQQTTCEDVAYMETEKESIRQIQTNIKVHSLIHLFIFYFSFFK